MQGFTAHRELRLKPRALVLGSALTLVVAFSPGQEQAAGVWET